MSRLSGEEGECGKGDVAVDLGALRFSKDSVHLLSGCPSSHLAVHRCRRPGWILCAVSGAHCADLIAPPSRR